MPEGSNPRRHSRGWSNSNMQKRIYSWLGREFIELSGEAQPATSVEEETDDLFRRFERS